MLAEMMRLTLGIAAKTLFDADVGDQAEQSAHALHSDAAELHCTLQQPDAHSPQHSDTGQSPHCAGPSAGSTTSSMASFASAGASGEDKGDLLSMLLHARDESDRTGMTDRQLRDEAMTLFLAGHETTALTLSWAWYLLARHPDAAAKMAAEVDAVVGSRRPAVEDLPRLRFTEWIVLEAMRLYPPAYVLGREPLHDCEIMGYHVPAGTTLFMSNWVVHRDARWFDEPEAFRPGALGRDPGEAPCRSTPTSPSGADRASASATSSR